MTNIPCTMTFTVLGSGGLLLRVRGETLHCDDEMPPDEALALARGIVAVHEANALLQKKREEESRGLGG